MNNLSITTNSVPVKSAKSALRKAIHDNTARSRTVTIACKPPTLGLGMMMDPVSCVRLSAKTISDGERVKSEEVRRVNWGECNLISCTYGPEEYDRTCEVLPYFRWNAKQQRNLLQELKAELKDVYVHPSSPSAMSSTIMPYKEDIPILKEWSTRLASLFHRLTQPSPSVVDDPGDAPYDPNSTQHFVARGL
ncbi:hypothetical protein SARC_00670 [Sphaeroforma arctica JP610]|uniref:Uncharacterized protein n=1 Tax=Sphaeroforma arctica JP610 TaxID=667725 RepID=A0A0L0GFY5_9EUKA|nr:hypothetical protein SARC_00670 [Sphaeroforma arctica JP610]KNC87193.1 hypothetical protein SARC_00670 [Sphaeroforma arctica JP610]|eukprot:XP_014161095.1 hypothetical protein SARC_00670 [Sphaeroforma arctica JP610]